MGQLTGVCSEQQSRSKTTQLSIERVSNGYIVGGYQVERKVTLTIGEALEIIRKEME
jgi:hypothetical protein